MHLVNGRNIITGRIFNHLESYHLAGYRGQGNSLSVYQIAANQKINIETTRNITIVSDIDADYFWCTDSNDRR